MGGNSREGQPNSSLRKSCSHANKLYAGGKAKPLKAPKKEKKELDEDEIAYRDKQKAGMRQHCQRRAQGQAR